MRFRIAVAIKPFAGLAGEDKLSSSVFLGSGILFLAMVFVATAIAGALSRQSIPAPSLTLTS